MRGGRGCPEAVALMAGCSHVWFQCLVVILFYTFLCKITATSVCGRCRSHSLWKEVRAWESGNTRARVGKYAGQESGNIKEGVGNHENMLLFDHAKQDVNLQDVLHRNYIPKTDKPCMLNPRPYVNPKSYRTLMPLTLKPSDQKLSSSGN